MFDEAINQIWEPKQCGYILVVRSFKFWEMRNMVGARTRDGYRVSWHVCSR